MAKYKAGQFISTPFGRMRVRKIKSFYPPCNKCAMTSVSNCSKFAHMHCLNCIEIIGFNSYLEKV